MCRPEHSLTAYFLCYTGNFYDQQMIHFVSKSNTVSFLAATPIKEFYPCGVVRALSEEDNQGHLDFTDQNKFFKSTVALISALAPSSESCVRGSNTKSGSNISMSREI